MAGWRSLIALGVCLAAAVQLVASTPITEYVAMAPAGGGGGPDRAATTVSSSTTCTKKHTHGLRLDRKNLMMRVGTVASCSIWHVHGRVAVSGALGALDRVVGSDQKLERCFLVVCLSLYSQAPGPRVSCRCAHPPAPAPGTPLQEAIVKWVLLQYDTDASQVDDVKVS